MKRVLRDWLAPLPPDEFFQSVWGQKEALIPIASHVTIPFGLDDFEQLLNEGRLRYPQVKVVDPNGPVDARLYTRTTSERLDEAIDPQKLQQLVLAHKTVRISRIQTVHAGMREFVSRLSHAFGCDVSVNAYYCRGPSGGMNPHYDSHHIFAAQLAGAKEWQVGPLVVDTPSHDFHPGIAAPLTPERHLVVKGGQMLYIPPGLWHDVFTPDVSLHLTVGIHPPLWSDVLQGIVRRATAMHPLLRSHLPFQLDDNGRCVYRLEVGDEVTAILNHLRNEIPDNVGELLERTAPDSTGVTLPRPVSLPKEHL